VDEPEVVSIPTLAQAARAITAARIDDLAARWADLDPTDSETVKKLRVATRRLRAAQSAFKSLYVKRKPVKRLTEQLGELTTALGAARDAAVLRGRLDDWAATTHTSAALALLREQLERQEAEAQTTLVATLDKFDRDALISRARKLLLKGLPSEAVSDKPDVAVAALPLTLAALPLLRDRFDAEQSARATALETTDPLSLHNERLAIKRLRYSLELFAAYFAPATPTIAMLKNLQTQLGDLQDCDVLIVMVSVAEAAQPALAEVRARMDNRRATLLAAHLAYRCEIDAGEWGQLAAQWQVLLDRQLSPAEGELAQAGGLRITDWPHARQVQRLALSLFDQLAATFRLAERDRAILARAALLHDAGMVAGPRGHHLRSYKLLRKAKPRGLDKREREIVALVARYHRRDLPSSEHAAYAALKPKQQAQVSRLAALLRIADGLDYEHDGAARDLVAACNDSSLSITVSGAGDCEITRARAKSGLILPAFGYPVRIEAAT
jgi:CHAD domain-containing protein